MTCSICLREMPDLADSRKHDSAPHVANAYHQPSGGKCMACAEPFPCATRRAYVPHIEVA